MSHIPYEKQATNNECDNYFNVVFSSQLENQNNGTGIYCQEVYKRFSCLMATLPAFTIEQAHTIATKYFKETIPQGMSLRTMVDDFFDARFIERIDKEFYKIKTRQHSEYLVDYGRIVGVSFDDMRSFLHDKENIQATVHKESLSLRLFRMYLTNPKHFEGTMVSCINCKVHKVFLAYMKAVLYFPYSKDIENLVAFADAIIDHEEKGSRKAIIYLDFNTLDKF